MWFLSFFQKNYTKINPFCFIISELKIVFAFREASKSRALNIFNYLKPYVPSFRNRTII